MKQTYLLIILSLFILSCSTENDSSKITFNSLDGLEITADLYEINNNAPVIVLCHQEMFNKYEYKTIAKKLNKRGFNCIALDQRTGGSIVDKINETAIRARREKKPTGFLDSEQDIIAAINYAYNKYDKKVILWGSSYSATLVLYIACDNIKVKAVIAFSPADYFRVNKGSLIYKLANFKKPMFVTSSKLEAESLKQLLGKINLQNNQICFQPKCDGYQGSKALWDQQLGSHEYWSALEVFLRILK